jgi:hypothetical protein
MHYVHCLSTPLNVLTVLTFQKAIAVENSIAKEQASITTYYYIKGSIFSKEASSLKCYEDPYGILSQ